MELIPCLGDMIKYSSIIHSASCTILNSLKPNDVIMRFALQLGVTIIYTRYLLTTRHTGDNKDTIPTCVN